MPKLTLIVCILLIAACSADKKTPKSFAEDICDCYQNVRDSVGLAEAMVLMDNLDACIEYTKGEYNNELEVAEFTSEALEHVRTCLDDDSIKVIEDI